MSSGTGVTAASGVRSARERSGEVQSVARAGQLLNDVVDAPDGLTLTELAAGTHLNISTAPSSGGTRS